jgi:protease-4
MAMKNKRLIGWLVGFLVLIGVITGAGLMMLLDTGPVISRSESSWLVVKVEAGMGDAPGDEGFAMDPESIPPLSTELSSAIRHAATDPKVSKILLKINGLDVGWAQTTDIRNALRTFRDSGKHCTAWANGYDTKTYYLASVCDTVAMSPEGITLVTGMNVTTTYYSETLSMLGISANFEHVGDYKSAVEPYERSGPSEAAAMATNELLDSLYGAIISGIADGRGLDDESVRILIDDPPLTALAAVDRGMIDERIYEIEMLDTVIGDEPTLKLSDYIGSLKDPWGSEGNVTVLYADGPIILGRGGVGLFGDNVIGSVTTSRQLKKLAEDDGVDAVVLRVNSPGGSGQASDDIWQAINILKEAKPVVVSMGDYAASGGYYISMNADRIFAEATTVTGSIGVFGGKMNLAGLFAKAGMSQFEFSRGARSDLLSTMEDFDPEDQALFRSFLEHFYDVFITKAAKGRGMTKEAVHAVAQGRVWTGIQALENGLVDELGSLDDAIAAAAELASIGENYGVDRLPKRKDFFEQLVEELGGAPSDDVRLPAASVPRSLRHPLQTLLLLDTILADGGVAAMMPGLLEVN